jgi:hypothetical protein
MKKPVTAVVCTVVFLALTPVVATAQMPPKYSEKGEIPTKPPSGATQKAPASTPLTSTPATTSPPATSAPAGSAAVASAPATVPCLPSPTSCANGPLVSHSNGLGQTYVNCSRMATPGNPATYNASLAMSAANAWGPAVAMLQITCGAAPAVMKQAQTSCAVWAYGGSTAGHVSLNSASKNCLCPSLGDSVWN